MYSKNHPNKYIICGYGKLGKSIAAELKTHDQEYVIVEKDEKKCKQLESLSEPHICGNAKNVDTLREAGIKKSQGIVITFSDNSEALYTAFSVKEIDSSLDIVCGASGKEAYRNLKKAGVKKVLMMDKLISNRMLAHIVKPSLSHSLDLLTKNDQEQLVVEEFTIDDFSKFINKDFESIQKLVTSKAIILGMLRAGTDEYIFNPVADTKVCKGDTLTIMGYLNELEELKELLASER
jgi:voltage-gated potassium channel